MIKLLPLTLYDVNHVPKFTKRCALICFSSLGDSVCDDSYLKLSSLNDWASGRNPSSSLSSDNGTVSSSVIWKRLGFPMGEMLKLELTLDIL